jgi:hypothetical protein
MRVNALGGYDWLAIAVYFSVLLGVATWVVPGLLKYTIAGRV